MNILFHILLLISKRKPDDTFDLLTLHINFQIVKCSSDKIIVTRLQF